MPTTRIDGWPGLMSVQTAALYLDKSVRTIEKWQAEGELIPVDAAGKCFSKAELDRFIDTRPDWTNR